MANVLLMQDDGTTLEVSVTKETLQSDSVYCVIDESTRSIWLWIGKVAGVRLRFVGARTANKMRNDLGTGFRVRSLDEGQESPHFFTALVQE
ncbi:MAG: hypothetical protein EAX81_00455 [Candidatus Thorarchaeota archaeon]|nr:hypothetical protein [Candidatus Thorarchaeota archaeon]